MEFKTFTYFYLCWIKNKMTTFVVEINILNQITVSNLKIFQFTAMFFYYKRLPCAYKYNKIENVLLLIFTIVKCTLNLHICHFYVYLRVLQIV